MLRKVVSVIASVMALGAMTFGFSGCATGWTITVQSIIAGAQTFEGAAQVVLNLAGTAFNVVLPLIPVASQAQAQADFQKAMAAANAAMATLEAAVQTAIDSQAAAPNFAVLEQDVSNVVSAVVAFVNALQPPATSMLPSTATGQPKAVNLTAFTEMNNALLSMKHVGHIK
jgi:hypothetical protein